VIDGAVRSAVAQDRTSTPLVERLPSWIIEEHIFSLERLIPRTDARYCITVALDTLQHNHGVAGELQLPPRRGGAHPGSTDTFRGWLPPWVGDGNTPEGVALPTRLHLGLLWVDHDPPIELAKGAESAVSGRYFSSLLGKVEVIDTHHPASTFDALGGRFVIHCTLHAGAIDFDNLQEALLSVGEDPHVSSPTGRFWKWCHGGDTPPVANPPETH